METDKKSMVWIGNLSFSTSTSTLKDEFSQFGEVLKVDIPTYKESGKPKGFAFVHFKESGDAEAAIKKTNGITLDGRQIAVEIAGKEPRAKRGGYGGYSSSRGRGSYRGGGSRGSRYRSRSPRRSPYSRRRSPYENRRRRYSRSASPERRRRSPDSHRKRSHS